jgi:aminopeptidase N
LKNAADSFYFISDAEPEWITVDPDRYLLCEKSDNKTEAHYIAQWKYGKTYLDRKESIDYFAKNSMPQLANGLQDKFYKLRIATIQKLSSSSMKNDANIIAQIEELAKTEKNRNVKAAAINFLVKNGDVKYQSIYESAINDSSYSVAGAAFKGLAALNPEGAYELAKKYSNDAKGDLGNAVIDILISKGTEADFEFVSSTYNDLPPSQEKFAMNDKFADYLLKVNDISKIKTGIDYMLNFRKMIPEQYRSFIDPGYKKAFDKLSKAKGKEVEEYVNSVFK